MRNIMISGLSALTLLAAPAFAQDLERGERVFKKCSACHTHGEGAANKIGPQLNGIIGREAGTVADFSYSEALMTQAADGLVWDEASLDAFLTKPKDFMAGTKMTFPGLRKEDDRVNLIAYLATFGDGS